MHSHMFRMFYRCDLYHDDSLVKIAVGDDCHWLTGREMKAAYERGQPVHTSALLRATEEALKERGMSGCERLFAGKQVFFEGGLLPLERLAGIGWDLEPYPWKYTASPDRAAILADVREKGISVDVANLVGSDQTVDTRGLVLKGVVDLLDRQGVPFNMYEDYSAWGWLRRHCGEEAYRYLMSFPREGKLRRVFTPKDESADARMLRWADADGMHCLSRDEFDEFDLSYDWVLHGAERGRPRLHKFRRIGDRIEIPDLGIAGDIPGSF